jgi:hypothetical protein
MKEISQTDTIAALKTIAQAVPSSYSHFGSLRLDPHSTYRYLSLSFIMFKQLMRAFLPLLILAVAPCQGVEQLIRVDATMRLKVVLPGVGPTFLADRSAISTFESIARKYLEVGINDNDAASDLFTADPAILNLKVIGADNVRWDAMDVTYTITFRTTSSSRLNGNDLLNANWGGYYDQLNNAKFSIELARSLPSLFGKVVGFKVTFSNFKEVSDPNAPLSPIAPRPTRPPTPQPTPRPPIRPPTRRPTPPPTFRPGCLVYWKACSSDAQCCSERCNLTEGRCDRRV